VDTRKGEQFAPEFLKINPNGKVPAIVDGETTVFDSNAILLYLAEKTGKFLAPAALRGEFLSWLMFAATGVGPYSGQAVHFKHFAPERFAYATKRYLFEVERHYSVLNEHLALQKYMVGETYTIVDMDVWGWTRLATFILGDNCWDKFPHLKRLYDEIDARPAAGRAKTLKDRFTFKPEMDDEARKHMFKHLAA